MIESKLTKINVFSSKQQYDENKGQLSPDEISLVPYTYDAVPVGFVISSASNEVPDGYLLCNGGQVSRSTYANLFNKIGTTYGNGDGVASFNLPNVTDRFIQGSATVGTVKSAGLPNITGFSGSFQKNYSYRTDTDYQGAMYQYSTITKGSTDGNQGNDYCASIGFDASRSNAIYGASNTVQPPALTMRFYIKY